VLPETLLLLELEAQEPRRDLRRISQLVLGDLGATVQVLRLAAREYDNIESRPQRIEDCVADLGVDACLEAVSLRVVAADRRRRPITDLWAHSREIAEYARLIADETSDVIPDQAYLVGLLHSIGLLPAILGGGWGEMGAVDEAFTGYRMARQWSLPFHVLEFFAETHSGGEFSRWTEIVRSAHRCASRSSCQRAAVAETRPLFFMSIQTC
jgi:HD-like signal output (HDOD) protein